ncbi:MAG: CBS domain-containing protein [bacterium]|nr:MAG: CBS domain-containing protein [bacterium]
MRVAEVMTKDVVTVTPKTSMSKFGDILRSKRISGTPVVSGGFLVGIISIEDFINWLEKGSKKARVKQCMTEKVITVFDDEPLAQVISKLEHYRYGRLPVIDRDSKKLVGLVTNGDIIEGLLHKVERVHNEEEIRRHQASNIFDDIIVDQTTLIYEYRVIGKDFKQAGAGTSRLRKTLSRLEIHPQVLRRAAIVAYEAEMNIVIYTDGGDLFAKVEPGMITIVARDKGPGIENIELALTPGYSTAEDWVRQLGFGAGMGLCNIKKVSDEMFLDSSVDDGTRLEARIAI